ncbi:hypothetical protein FIBSPDRAFT_899914 [Athelia psychrophila]|uniref:Uncharacterized protein n=1 Tax=Athelia psychrophila TaxID=1759441 RepID=A0A165Z4R1_9AGAM|nr:hypothetical protein FIBSPDRAFT_899914 [Fibularhizoctonia sp. CBS 109695]
MSWNNLDKPTGSPRRDRRLSPESSLNQDDRNQVSVRPLNSEHLYLARPTVATNTPRPAGSGTPRRRDNDGGRVAYRTNSEPQILAPTVINSSSSPIAAEPPGMRTDTPHNAGVLHPVGSSHPLASTLSILSPVSTIQSNVRIPLGDNLTFSHWQSRRSYHY